MRLNLAFGLTLSLFLGACHTIHAVDFLATPADRFVCEAAGARPKIPAEYVPDWSKAAAAKDVPSAVEIAKGEFAKFVAVLRTREGIEVGYILDLEGKNFVCFSNMQWRKNYEHELSRSHSAIRP